MNRIESNRRPAMVHRGTQARGSPLTGLKEGSGRRTIESQTTVIHSRQFHTFYSEQSAILQRAMQDTDNQQGQSPKAGTII